MFTLDTRLLDTDIVASPDHDWTGSDFCPTCNRDTILDVNFNAGGAHAVCRVCRKSHSL